MWLCPLGPCGSSGERLATNSGLIALECVPGDSYSVPVALSTGQGLLACVRSQSGLPGVVARARQLSLPPPEQEQGDSKRGGRGRASVGELRSGVVQVNACSSGLDLP